MLAVWCIAGRVPLPMPRGHVGNSDEEGDILASDILRMVVDDNPADGMARTGIAGGGRSDSVYMSRRMLDRPTMATGWFEKWSRADSNSSSARYGVPLAMEMQPS